MYFNGMNSKGYNSYTLIKRIEIVFLHRNGRWTQESYTAIHKTQIDGFTMKVYSKEMKEVLNNTQYGKWLHSYWLYLLFHTV